MLTGGVVAAMAVASLAGAAPAGGRLPTALPDSGYAARPREDALKLPRDKAAGIRGDALAHARLWLEPRPSLDLAHNAPDLRGGADEVVCKFYPHKVEGTTRSSSASSRGARSSRSSTAGTGRSTPRRPPPGSCTPSEPARTRSPSSSGSVASVVPRTRR